MSATEPTSCPNEGCRLMWRHPGPCDVRSDDQVALAVPSGPHINALANALAHVRAMARPNVPTPYAYAAGAMQQLEAEGWTLTHNGDLAHE